MAHPVSEFLEWFDTFSKEDQGEMAFLLSMTNPAFDGAAMFADHENLAATFKARVASFNDAKMQSVGFVISLRAMFEFSIVGKRGNPKSWEKTRMLFERVKNQTDPVPPESVLKTAEQSLAGLPERQEKWFEICRKWKLFKNAHWSDERLEAWEDDVMLGRTAKRQG